MNRQMLISDLSQCENESEPYDVFMTSLKILKICIQNHLNSTYISILKFHVSPYFTHDLYFI